MKWTTEDMQNLIDWNPQNNASPNVATPWNYNKFKTGEGNDAWDEAGSQLASWFDQNKDTNDIDKQKKLYAYDLATALASQKNEDKNKSEEELRNDIDTNYQELVNRASGKTGGGIGDMSNAKDIRKNYFGSQEDNVLLNGWNDLHNTIGEGLAWLGDTSAEGIAGVANKLFNQDPNDENSFVNKSKKFLQDNVFTKEHMSMVPSLIEDVGLTALAPVTGGASLGVLAGKTALESAPGIVDALNKQDTITGVMKSDGNRLKETAISALPVAMTALPFLGKPIAKAVGTVGSKIPILKDKQGIKLAAEALKDGATPKVVSGVTGGEELWKTPYSRITNMIEDSLDFSNIKAPKMTPPEEIKEAINATKDAKKIAAGKHVAADAAENTAEQAAKEVTEETTKEAEKKGLFKRGFEKGKELAGKAAQKGKEAIPLTEEGKAVRTNAIDQALEEGGATWKNRSINPLGLKPPFIHPIRMVNNVVRNNIVPVGVMAANSYLNDGNINGQEITDMAIASTLAGLGNKAGTRAMTRALAKSPTVKGGATGTNLPIPRMADPLRGMSAFGPQSVSSGNAYNTFKLAAALNAMDQSHKVPITEIQDSASLKQYINELNSFYANKQKNKKRGA